MMDPAKTTLGRMLLNQITPAVMVNRTPLVEESCRRNGLSFIEMLKPFCNFNNIDVPVRTASDQPYRLRRLKLRLFYASEIRQPNIEVAKERLKQVITNAGDKDISEMCSDPPEIGNAVLTSELELVPSWFRIFNKELVDTVSFSEHEAFDHPVAYKFVQFLALRLSLRRIKIPSTNLLTSLTRVSCHLSLMMVPWIPRF